MRKIIVLLAVLAVASIGFYWFKIQGQEFPESINESNIAASDTETGKVCDFPRASSGDMVQVEEITPSGFKVRVAAWEGDYPERNYTVLIDNETIFCDGPDFDFDDIPVGHFLQIKSGNEIPREADGFPRADIIVNASEISAI